MNAAANKKPPLVVNATSKPFWDGIARGELLLQYDPQAQRYQFYPRPLSLHVAGLPLEWRASRGEGVLVALTLTYFPAPGFEAETPYVEGLVQLDEGPRIFSPITGSPYDALQVGMRMRVCWPAQCGGTHPFQFQPIEGHA